MAEEHARREVIERIGTDALVPADADCDHAITALLNAGVAAVTGKTETMVALTASERLEREADAVSAGVQAVLEMDRLHELLDMSAGRVELWADTAFVEGRLRQAEDQGCCSRC